MSPLDATTGGFQAPDEDQIALVTITPGTFRLTEVDPKEGETPETCTAYLTGAVVPVAGYGGWSRVARPRRIALTEWVGRDAMSLEIPFMFDAYAETDLEVDGGPGLFIETNIRALERMAGIDEDDPEPPIVNITSNPPKLIPHNERRASHVDWFVENISWDKDSIISNKGGNRVRAAGTITLTQFVKDERLGIVKSDKKRGGKLKSYTVRKGDTLQKIAARKDVYGDAKKWVRLKKANNIRDSKHLKVGRKLKIP